MTEQLALFAEPEHDRVSRPARQRRRRAPIARPAVAYTAPEQIEPERCSRCTARCEAPWMECVCYMVESHDDACPAVIRTERIETTKRGKITRTPVSYATPHLCTCARPQAVVAAKHL